MRCISSRAIIQAYQLNFFEPHMDSGGIDADRLAIVASLGLVPIGITSTAVAFLVAYFIDPSESFPVLATMVIAATFLMALFDTTADALSVDVVPEPDHGTVQAWMNRGRAVGLVLVSLVFGLIADRLGYRYIFLVVAGLLPVPLAYVNRVREPRHRTPAQSFDRTAFRVMLQPRYGVFALVLVGAWTCFEAIDGLVTYYMSNELASAGGTIGLYGTLKGTRILAGGVALARVVRSRGRATAAIVTLLLVSP